MHAERKYLWETFFQSISTAAIEKCLAPLKSTYLYLVLLCIAQISRIFCIAQISRIYFFVKNCSNFTSLFHTPIIPFGRWFSLIVL